MEINKNFFGIQIKITGIMFLVLFGFQVSWVYGGEPIQLLSFHGKVEHKTFGEKTWQAVSGDIHFQPGDVLRTGTQSKAELEFEGGVIRMYENTILELPKDIKRMENNSANERMSTHLKQGKSLFKILKDALERPFEVVTPSLIAGVKGTIFKVIQEEQVKSVEVFEGIVEVSNRGRPEERVNVGMGWKTLIENGRLTDPLPFDKERGWEDWNSLNAIQAVRDSKMDDPEISSSSVEDLGELEKESTFDQRLTDQENERLSDLLGNSQEFRREIQTGSSRIPALSDVEKERAVGDSQFIITQGTSSASSNTGTITGSPNSSPTVTDSSEDLTGTAFPSLLP